MALGAFTNNLAFFSSIKVKSAIAEDTAIPPPQVPNTAEICGITPEAMV